MTLAELAFTSRGREGTQSFAEEPARQRLTRAGLTAMISLAGEWKLTTTEAAALLGVSTSTWERMKRGDQGGALSQDQLTRISALVGVYKGLHLVFADDMSDRWVRLNNRGEVFEGASPIASMIEGGIPRMLEVRRHVDALRGGL